MSVNPHLFYALGASVGELVDEKARQYGGTSEKTAAIVAQLYPDGIPAHAYPDLLLMVRTLDKLSRIAQRGPDGKDLGGESPWRDVAGYGLLGLAQDSKR